MSENVSCCGGGAARPAEGDPFAWFAGMIPNCLRHATAQRAAGRPIIGIMCEFTPREIIMAAGGVPVCLCGGSVITIPAAEEELPVNLCPLIKSTYGYHKLGTNPFLEMADLIVAETTCDGKKKMYELMGRTRPMYVLELPQKPGDPDALAHWERELRKLVAELEHRFATTITPDTLQAAIASMNRERALRRALADLMASPVPPLTGRQLLELKSSISGVCADMAQYEAALALLRARVPDVPAVAPVRVLLTGVPTPHGAERVIDLIEGAGGLVVAQENCTGLKPILEDVIAETDDPIRAIAVKYFHLPCSVMTPNNARQESLRALAARFRPDCVIELIWQSCLTYHVESHLIKEYVATELDLPYLRIETDYAPADSPRITLRVEALFETVRARTAGGPPSRQQS